MEENNNKPIGFIQIDRTYADSRSALRGRVTGKLAPYGGRWIERKNSIWGYPIGKSGQDCCPRPVKPHLYYTTSRRICQVLFQKKIRGFFNPQIQYTGRQAVHHRTTITAGHVGSGFCSHVGAVRTTLLDFQSQSSSSQGALPKPSKWQRGYSSPSSCQ